MFAWLSTLKGDLWGKSLAERSYREDGNLSGPYAGPPGSTLLDGCRWRVCLVVALFGANTPSRSTGPFRSSSRRGCVLLAVAVCRCVVLLWLTL